MEGLYITDLCEDRISVDTNVVDEMQQLRTESSLEISYEQKSQTPCGIMGVVDRIVLIITV